MRQFFVFFWWLGATLALAQGQIPAHYERVLFKCAGLQQLSGDLSDPGLLPPRPLPLAPVTAESGPERRRSGLASFPLSQVVASPGNRNAVADAADEKVVLNVITDASGRPLEIDLWTAHERVVSYQRGGLGTVGEIPVEQLEILVNGVSAQGETRDHLVSASGLDPQAVPGAPEAPRGARARFGTLLVPGHLSNYALGSRETLGALARVRAGRRGPRIGVYFGTFDPVHEGHMSVLLDAKRRLALDELVVVPNQTAAHKPNATGYGTRLEMLKARLREEPGINLYVGASADLVDRFSRTVLIDQIAQAYGAGELYQIIGQDSFAGFLEGGWLDTDQGMHYLVYPREGTNAVAFDVPAGMQGRVQVAHDYDDRGLSSSLIRSQLQSGIAPPPSELHPEVLRVIREQGLYPPAAR